MASSPDSISPRQVIRAGMCIGCGACVAGLAPETARMELDGYGQYKPAGPRGFTDSPTPALAQLCPFSPNARDEDQLAAARFAHAPHEDDRLGWFDTAYVGAVVEAPYRDTGSSGGMVSWVAAELLRRGLVDGVAHVKPADEGPHFGYVISRTVESVLEGAKSRYYPVELSGIIDEIRRVPGRYAIVDRKSTRLN